MVEWSITVVLKTTVPRGTGGSNPSLSAKNPRNLLKISRFLFFMQKLLPLIVRHLLRHFYVATPVFSDISGIVTKESSVIISNITDCLSVSSRLFDHHHGQGSLKSVIGSSLSELCVVTSLSFVQSFVKLGFRHLQSWIVFSPDVQILASDSLL